MHCFSGTSGTFASQKFAELQTPQFNNNHQISIQETPIKPTSEFDLMQIEHNAVVADIALFAEYNTAGSLFSIHSAPPVPLTDMCNITCCIQANRFDGESPRRPISLAIESQQNLSTKTIAAFPLPSSEIDEDDNENLLTVSSVTARPLIAKSRELRTSK